MMIETALTDRQKEVLKFIEGFILKFSYPPTRNEIAEGFDFASANAAEQHLRALERKGFIALSAGISRGIVIKKASLPLKRQKKGEVEMPDYLVEMAQDAKNVEARERLVRAKNESTAIKHVIEDTITITRATTEDIVRLAKAGVELERAE